MSDPTMRGTCLTSNECAGQGGTADGGCAAGFGVCCMFTLSTCGGTVNQNCTYVQNEGFPTASMTEQTCTYMFNRICPGEFYQVLLTSGVHWVTFRQGVK